MSHLRGLPPFTVAALAIGTLVAAVLLIALLEQLFARWRRGAHGSAPPPPVPEVPERIPYAASGVYTVQPRDDAG